MLNSAKRTRVVTTTTPSNEAELQLYRVLQRASLLEYYETFLEMGGDDLQQLCDAGEEEFLEIMALVNMASKPLHVRRLQKSLHEWVNNPSFFQTPISSIEHVRSAFSPEPVTQSRSPFSTSQPYSPSSITGSSSSNPTFSNINSITNLSTSASSSHLSSTTVPLTPTLTENQVARLTAAAETLSRVLPPFEPRAHSSKKRSSKDGWDVVMGMNDCDPRRMEEIRKFSAIYGRFDCKRRAEKPLTLHEVCVNEAAAQICKIVPALLTRRNELFPYARKVVKDSGLGLAAGMARFSMCPSMSKIVEHDVNQPKRMRLGSDTSSDYNKETTEELRNNLLAIYQKLGKRFDFSDTPKVPLNYPRSEYDDGDSQFSFSNSSSPPCQLSNSEDNGLGNVDVEDTKMSSFDLKKSPDSHSMGNGSASAPPGVHVISASGSHIIAVANPALVDSMAIKRERMTPDL
ncbi:NGFI-A-binding protein like [Pseudolycoriella hygida]|uniref:NGFI-A-binding protein like n=1 Tax=Pseudolycoriella hygida TaxID=35572 RepID=A0A9Q0MJ21_9DIPT|nr:NGFI-A-binding protein like [Pseudolycoriella hygida]